MPKTPKRPERFHRAATLASQGYDPDRYFAALQRARERRERLSQLAQQRDASDPQEAATEPVSTGNPSRKIAAAGAAANRGMAQKNEATRRRLRQVLSLYRGMGDAQRRRVGRQETYDTAMARQSLINRGLGNATVVGPMMNRIREQADLARLDIADQVAARLGDTLSSVVDAGPNVGAYAQYAERLGRYGTMPRG